MKRKTNPDEHAKDPRWQIPVDLPSVSPDDYMRDVKNSHGATTDVLQNDIAVSELESGPPHYTLPKGHHTHMQIKRKIAGAS